MPAAAHANVFLTNLALVLCVAAVTTVVFQRFRQPVVLGYLLAGLIVGPYVPVPLVADREIVHDLSELGVVLLLFSIGLEFTFRKLFRVGATAGAVAVVQVSAMVLLGDLAGRALGWSARESLYAGAIVAISSTTIIAKAFEENRVGGHLRELVLAVLVVEDLVGILLLAALTTLSAGKLSPGALAATTGRLALFLVAVIVLGMLVVPRLVRSIVRLERPETLVVTCTGIAFGLALLAHRFGYSVALGAFLAGSLVAESGEGERIEHLMQPVRDLFGAVFFVSVGMLIDPALVVRNWPAVALLTAVVLAGKIVGVSIPAFLTGASVRTSVAAGMSLAQIGEFSFIIAGLGLSLGATREFLYPVAVAVSAVTTLTTPWLIRASPDVAAWVDRKLPRPLQTLAALYGAWIEDLRAGRPVGPLRRRVRLLVLDSALLAVVVVAGAELFPRLAAFFGKHLGPRAALAAAFAVCAAVAAPFAIGIVRLVGAVAVALATRALPEPGRGLDLAAAPRRALLVSLQLVTALALGLPLVAVVQPFFPAGVAAAGLVVVLAALGVRLWRSAADLQGHVRAGAQVVVEALTSGAGAAERSAPAVPYLPGMGSPVRFALTDGNPAVGRSLAALDLRAQTGATVLAIRRGEAGLLVPTGHELLQAGDVLALAGTREAVQAAKSLLGGGVSDG
jgi:CPA2 family monovalent cation:H+ antiporter-2